MISHPLLQNLRFRKPILSFTIPDQHFLDFSTGSLVCEMYLEKTSRGWDQSYFSNGCAEGAEEFLGEPCLPRFY